MRLRRNSLYERPLHCAPMAAEAVVGTLGKALQDDKKPDEEVLQFKDLVWDQFLKYISSAILALTILNLSVEFLRGGGVLCFPPLVTKSVHADISQVNFFTSFAWSIQ